MAAQREKRQNIRRPERYGDWQYGAVKVESERVKEKLWDVEDIISKRGQAGDEEVLIKWKNWDGPNSWVGLKFNNELAQYLSQNKANPDSCTLNRIALGIIPLTLPNANSDVMALRQAIFDSLSEVRYTPEGTVGRQTRVTIKLRFRKEAFDETFRAIGHSDIPADSSSNVDCYVTDEDVTLAIGEGWSSRCYSTSTETFVSAKEYIHLWWGYKERYGFFHSDCKRCHWNGDETQRPEMCNPERFPILGPAWIYLTFTRGRRNMVTGDISKRRKLHK